MDQKGRLRKVHILKVSENLGRSGSVYIYNIIFIPQWFISVQYVIVTRRVLLFIHIYLYKL